MIESFVEEGISIFRINMAHGTHEKMRETIELIHEIFRKKKSTRYSIILDTEGCFPRTGHLEDSQEIEFNTGDEVSLIVDEEFMGNK